MSWGDIAYQNAQQNDEVLIDEEPEEKMTVPRAKEIIKPGDSIRVPNPSAKWNNIIVVYHCHRRGVLVFDSVLEFNRYIHLREMEKAGEIVGLELQKKFILYPKTSQYKRETYTCDFFYARKGVEVVEDTKGKRLPLFALKWRVMQDKFPQYEYREVYR